jgi:oligopeptide/dipeptide ABC transporter ATP-binding protein
MPANTKACDRVVYDVVVTALLEVRNLTVRFAAGTGRAAAVRDVSFAIASGESLGLVGESGSGKSVTALAIMRLLPVHAETAGEIYFEGRNLLTTSSRGMRSLRGSKLAMIFQEPMTALNPVMRVGDQIAEAILSHANVDGSRVDKRQAWARAVEVMDIVAIPQAERRARDYPHQLSGGMRQRIMIAMAVVNRPQLLIADEPTTALDVTIQAQILDLLAELRERFGLAMLFISHDLAVVSRIAHRVAVMYGGSIVEMGDVSAIFTRPAHPYTRGLLGSIPTLRTERGKPLRTLEGTVPSITAMPQGCGFEPRCPSRIQDCATAYPPLVEVAPGHLARCPVVNSE